VVETRENHDCSIAVFNGFRDQSEKPILGTCVSYSKNHCVQTNELMIVAFLKENEVDDHDARGEPCGTQFPVRIRKSKHEHYQSTKSYFQYRGPSSLRFLMHKIIPPLLQFLRWHELSLWQICLARARSLFFQGRLHQQYLNTAAFQNLTELPRTTPEEHCLTVFPRMILFQRRALLGEI